MESLLGPRRVLRARLTGRQGRRRCPENSWVVAFVRSKEDRTPFSLLHTDGVVSSCSVTRPGFASTGRVLLQREGMPNGRALHRALGAW